MTALTPLAQQLFTAQVEYFVARTQDHLLEAITQEVQDFFGKAQETTLSTWLPQQQCLTLLTYYLCEYPLEDELVAQLETFILRLYQHPRLESTTWGELINDTELEEFIDVALSLRGLHLIVRRVSRNRWVTNAISDMLYRGITGFVSQGTARAEQMASSIPGAGSMFKLGKSVVGRTTSGFSKSAEDNIKRYINANIRSIIKSSEKRLQTAIDDGHVKSALLQSWQQVKHQPLSSLREYASEEDLKAALQGGMDFWEQLRQSEYFQQLLERIVGIVYDYVDSKPLGEWLLLLGISEASLSTELHRIASPTLAHWHSQGCIQAFFERQLIPFWEHACEAGWLPEG